MTALSPRERAELLTAGCDHVETLAELTERLAEGRPLRVYLGLDPTSPDLHIGHAVVLRLLQRFVDDKDDVTLLIGDFTARIGDPSGRNALRPNDVLVAETGTASMGLGFAQMPAGASFHNQTLWGSIGWATPAAFGAALAAPTRRVVLDRPALDRRAIEGEKYDRGDRDEKEHQNADHPYDQGDAGGPSLHLHGLERPERASAQEVRDHDRDRHNGESRRKGEVVRQANVVVDHIAYQVGPGP